MPTYEYHCAANGKVIEVSHKMAETVRTWGELCARAELKPGNTPANAPVTKWLSAGFVNTGARTAEVCDSPGCGSGACGFSPCGLQ